MRGVPAGSRLVAFALHALEESAAGAHRERSDARGDFGFPSPSSLNGMEMSPRLAGRSNSSGAPWGIRRSRERWTVLNAALNVRNSTTPLHNLSFLSRAPNLSLSGALLEVRHPLPVSLLTNREVNPTGAGHCSRCSSSLRGARHCVQKRRHGQGASRLMSAFDPKQTLGY